MVQVVGDAPKQRNCCGIGCKQTAVGLGVEDGQQLPEGLRELPFLSGQSRIDRVRHLIDAGADTLQFRNRGRGGNRSGSLLHLRLRLRHRSVYTCVYRRVYTVAHGRSMTALTVTLLAVKRCWPSRLLEHRRRDLNLPCWLRIGRANRRRNWWRGGAGRRCREFGEGNALCERRLESNRRSGWGNLTGQ